MRIGPFETGTTLTYKNQCIRTRFLAIGFPLIPISSLYVADIDKKFTIPFHWRSIFLGYARTTFLFAGTFLFASRGRDLELGILGGLFLILSLAAWIYFVYDNFEEDKTREKLGQAFSYNIHPKKLPRDLTTLFYKELNYIYQKNYPGANWQKDLTTSSYDQKQIDLLFALALYHHTLTPSNESSAMISAAKDLDRRLRMIMSNPAK